jgi:hypothetical protein
LAVIPSQVALAVFVLGVYVARRFLQTLQASVSDGVYCYIDKNADADGRDEAADGYSHNDQDKWGCFLLKLIFL